LIAVVIRWVRVRTIPVVVVIVAGGGVVLPVVVVVVAACTVIVGWVVVVLMTVRMVGDNFSRVPIGLFQIIEASIEASLFNSSSVEWVSLVCFGFVESES